MCFQNSVFFANMVDILNVTSNFILNGKVEYLFMFKVISAYYTSSPFSFLGSWTISF